MENFCSIMNGILTNQDSDTNEVVEVETYYVLVNLLMKTKFVHDLP